MCLNTGWGLFLSFYAAKFSFHSVVVFSPLATNFFIPPTKQVLSLEKYMHKPMYIIALSNSFVFISLSKIYFLSCF
jgi:hypothetical protein